MKREAFKAVGNPLLMGGPVLFSRDLAGGSAPPVLGTHALLVGTEGGAYGFVDGLFGDITPTTVSGLEIAYLQEAGDVLRLGLVGDAQIPGADVITVTGKWDGALTWPLVWSSGVNAYVSAVTPGINDFLAERLGQTLQLDLLTPPISQQDPSLTLSPDGNTLTYTVGVWEGSPPPQLRAELYDNNDDTVFSTDLPPGDHPVQPEWRGRDLALDEYADNGWEPIPRASSHPVAIPAGLDAQVEAILDGRDGFVIDGTDLGTMFQDSAGTVPVTDLGQPVARINSKWGTLACSYGNTNIAQQPLSDAKGLKFDGDDGLNSTTPALLAVLNGAAVVTVGVNFTPNVTNLNMCAVLLPRSSNATQTGFDIQMASTALVRAAVRRNDADATVTLVGPAAVAGEPYAVLTEADFAGTGLLSGDLDGTTPAPVTIPGTLGNATMTATASRLGTTGNTAARLQGFIGRVFLARFELTPEEKAIVQAWLEEV